MKEKRELYRRKVEKTIYTDIIAELEEAIVLSNSEKEKESNDAVNAIKEKLEKRIYEIEKMKEAESVRNIDKIFFPDHGEVFAANDKICIRVIQESEKNDYIAVSYEYSCMKGVFKEKNFRDELWKSFMSKQSFVCSIYDQATGNYLGYCSIKDLKKQDWELAIELKSEWCHRGYGTEAVSLFLRKLGVLTGNRFFRVRVDIDNYASQALMKKLGAYPNGISEFLLKGEELEKFREKNKAMIDDKIRAVAEEFCMNPEDILGYVLEYRIDISVLMLTRKN